MNTQTPNALAAATRKVLQLMLEHNLVTISPHPNGKVADVNTIRHGLGLFGLGLLGLPTWLATLGHIGWELFEHDFYPQVRPDWHETTQNSLVDIGAGLIGSMIGEPIHRRYGRKWAWIIPALIVGSQLEQWQLRARGGVH